ncbi:MAG: MMPL family transporter, partial [Dehalococcoidia bacterium]
MDSLARFSFRHRGIVLGAWILLTAGLFVLSATIGGAFRTSFDLPGSESQEALDILESGGFAERGSEGASTIVFQAEQGVDDPAIRAAMEALFARIAAEVPGASVTSPYDPAALHQVAEGRQVAYAELNFTDRTNEEFRDAADHVKEIAASTTVAGLTIEFGGDYFSEWYEPSSEFFGLIAAVIILIIAFGSLLAMGLPIVTALFGVGCGAAIIGILTRFIDAPEFTSQAAAMIGIGVGIDYALFIVTRYRQGLREGLEPEAAAVRALSTAGRAVAFAGITVVIAMLGMFLMDLAMIRAVAIACSVTVLMTMLAALTLLPAFLGFVGHRIDRFGLPHRRHAEGTARQSMWHRWSRLIQRHPWPAFLLGAGLLIALALPVFSMRLGFGDAGNRQDTDTTRRAFDVLSEGFGPGFNGPLIIVANHPAGLDQQALDDLAAQVRQTAGVAQLGQWVPNEQNTVAFLTVFPTTAPQAAETSDLVHRLRNDVIAVAGAPAQTGLRVTGLTANAVDFADYSSDRLPVFFGAVLALSFILLLAVFRSVLVPLKAVIMNLLSIGAAFGAMVAVFQWGWGAGLIGLGREGPIEVWAPMMLFAIVFGLSMDYEVFL